MASLVQTLFPATNATARSGVPNLQPQRINLPADPLSNQASFQDALGQASRKPPPKPQAAAKSQPSHSKKTSQSTKSRRSRQADDADDSQDVSTSRKARRPGPAKHDPADPTDPAVEESTADAASTEAKPQADEDSDTAAQNAAGTCAAANAAAKSQTDPNKPIATGEADAAANAEAKNERKVTVRPAVAPEQADVQEGDEAAADVATDDSATQANGEDPAAAAALAATKAAAPAQAAGAGQATGQAEVAPIRLGGPAVARRSTSSAIDPAAATGDASTANAASQAGAGSTQASTLPELLDAQASELMQVAVEPAENQKSKAGADPQDPTPAIEPPSAKGTSQTAAFKPAVAPQAPPETQFAEVNHPRIITGVRGELLPNGGSMHLRLDPPELGDLQVTVQMRDGVMSAAFQTSNDQATRLLSHSLGDLKAMLESQGVTVQKLHVEQAPREQRDPSSDSNQRQPNPEDQHSARQDQQRKDMIQKMWDKLLRGGDPVDLVA